MVAIFKKLGLYYHTIRHLKVVQLYGRVWFKLYHPRPDYSPAPIQRTPSGEWVHPAERQQSLFNDNEFLFLNERENLSKHGWDHPEQSKLWRYNLHYFDDLNAEGANQRRDAQHALIERWIDDNIAGEGSGWEPYPISLRLVNWIKFALAGETLSATALQSMAVQTRWLTKRMEWHLLGNHLLANAKALLFSGLIFDGPEAKKWRETAVSILLTELPEQILPDGGQFELTPMYHALALEDVLDLLNIMTAFRKELSDDEIVLYGQLESRVASMGTWLQTMSHPDGKIAFFNDAAFGIAPESSALFEYADRLGKHALQPEQAVTHLMDAGYVRIQSGAAVAICDIGKIGPDYLPGHAHADTLSFELSYEHQRILVNSGTSEYGVGHERLRQRSTKSHNTVTVDDQNSSEVWGGFRVARRATVDQVSIDNVDTTIAVSARHNGFRLLSNGPYHTRLWELSETGLEITDHLDPARQGTAFFHFHPEIGVTIDSGNNGKISLPNGKSMTWQSTGNNCAIEKSSWHPEFGKSIQNQCLSIDFSGNSKFSIDWS